MKGPREFFTYKKGALHAEGVNVEKLADEVGTPFYVYSRAGLLDPYQRLTRALKGLDATVCFAVKSNSNLAVLKLLVDAGAGLDLVSGGELHRAAMIGTPAERLVFSGVGKTPGEMAVALNYQSRGILSFHVESVEELATLSAVAVDLAQVAPVSLRFNPDVDAKTHPHVSTGLEENKFGMSREEILAIAAQLEAFPGVALQGLSVHIGSQITTLAPLERAFKRLIRLASQTEAAMGQPLTHLDLGGGLGIPYGDAPSARAPTIEQYGALIRRLFKALPYRLLLEPGRLISGNAGALVTEVLYRKSRPRRDFLIVDAGMNDLVRPALYDSFHEIVPARKSPPGAKLKATDVVGPVCETSDRFARARRLPIGLHQGDLVAILSAGAYGFSMASQYNSRPRPPELLVDGAQSRIIREREDYDDLVRGENP